MKVIDDDDDDFFPPRLSTKSRSCFPVAKNCCHGYPLQGTVTRALGGRSPPRNLRYPGHRRHRRRRRRRRHASLLPKIGADGFPLQGTVTRARDYNSEIRRGTGLWACRGLS